MKRRGAEDPVTPELRAYVLWRDQGCVIGRLVYSHDLAFELAGPCRARSGRDLGILMRVDPSLFDELLTIAHVRDRLGGRMGKRPPFLDAHLEAVEGPDRDPRRPWEAIARVRGIVDSAPSDQEGGSR